MFTGSMCGSGSVVFAVFTYAIVNARPDCESIVSLNPLVLAGVLGEDPADIENAIKTLCEPDKSSRTTEQEGRRLLRIGESMDYRVVNLEKYRFLDNENQKEYWREQKRKQRGKPSTQVNNNQRLSGTIKDIPRQVRKCPHADADTNADAKAKKSVCTELPHNFPVTVDDAVMQCSMVGADPVFITRLYNSAMSKHGKDGAGQPITSFRHYVAKHWPNEVSKRHESSISGNGNLGGADKVILGKEYERILDSMKSLKATYGDHQSWSKDDIQKWNKLKSRKLELKNTLGIKE